MKTGTDIGSLQYGLTSSQDPAWPARFPARVTTLGGQLMAGQTWPMKFTAAVSGITLTSFIGQFAPAAPKVYPAPWAISRIVPAAQRPAVVWSWQAPLGCPAMAFSTSLKFSTYDRSNEAGPFMPGGCGRWRYTTGLPQGHHDLLFTINAMFPDLMVPVPAPLLALEPYMQMALIVRGCPDLTDGAEAAIFLAWPGKPGGIGGAGNTESATICPSMYGQEFGSTAYNAACTVLEQYLDNINGFFVPNVVPVFYSRQVSWNISNAGAGATFSNQIVQNGWSGMIVGDDPDANYPAYGGQIVLTPDYS